MWEGSREVVTLPKDFLPPKSDCDVYGVKTYLGRRQVRRGGTTVVLCKLTILEEKADRPVFSPAETVDPAAVPQPGKCGRRGTPCQHHTPPRVRELSFARVSTGVTGPF